jgi:ketosteroid isomerase-like protein
MLGAAMFVVSACSTKSADQATDAKAADVAVKAPDNSADEANLKAAEAKWFELYNKGDAEGVSNLYAEDGQVFAPGAPAAVGRAAIRTFLVSDMAGLKKAGLTDNGGETTGVGVSGDLAWVSGVWYLTDAKGKHVDTGKYTTVYKRVGTDWQIVRDTWNTDTAPKA